MVTCVFCKSSEEAVLAGKRYNKKGETQRLKCNLCKRRFTLDDGFWKMKNSPKIIAEALSLKKRGLSYEEVSKHFKEYDRANICPATVYNWVKKYGYSLAEFNKKQTPKLSGKINMDEFIFKVKKKEMLSVGKQRQKNKVQDKRFIVEKQKLRRWG
jgi:transposase-like protein